MEAAQLLGVLMSCLNSHVVIITTECRGDFLLTKTQNNHETTNSTSKCR